jgi:hypothetical protein
LPIALFAAIYLRDSKEKNPQFVETANRIAGRNYPLYMVLWIGNYCAFDSGCFNLPVGETALAGSVV